jgi:diguanylate cyclase (GGDEF)-like protein
MAVSLGGLLLKQRKYSDKLFQKLQKSKKEQKQLNDLSDSILEISRAVVGSEDPEDLYDLILTKAIGIIPNANVGSILMRDSDGLFRSSAHKGFDDDKLKDLVLPLEETILWKFTKGKIKKTEVINDVSQIAELRIRPLTVDTDEWLIESTISVPLFMKNEVIGLLNIDSKFKNAFTRDDWKAMENIRSNIEVALQKHSLFNRMLTLSRFDELTGIYNRAYFLERLVSIQDSCNRYNLTFTLVIFDINDLKIVNDSHGHLAGDLMIKNFAQTFLKNLRKSDIFARWGGDEFVAILQNINQEKIHLKIENVAQILSLEPILFESEKIYCHFSFGCALYPDEGADYDKLLKIADERMYDHKKRMKRKARKAGNP